MYMFFICSIRITSDEFLVVGTKMEETRAEKPVSIFSVGRNSFTL